VCGMGGVISGVGSSRLRFFFFFFLKCEQAY